jgi:hypothetical protein
MSVPIQEAAEALVPLLSAGGDVAARELGRQAGSGFSRAVGRLVGKLRGSLKEPAPDVAQVEEALRKGLADGTIAVEDIQAVVALQASGRDSWNLGGSDISAGRDVNIGTSLHVEGDYEA